ncbi:MAG: hypothetical protein ACRC4K_06850 [Plesiomonas shigelloides]
MAQYDNDPQLQCTVAEYTTALVAGTNIKPASVRTLFWRLAIELINEILYAWDELAKNGLRKELLAVQTS